MGIVNIINLLLIGIAIVLCVGNGFRKRIFKILASVTALYLSAFLVREYGVLLLPDIDIISLKNELLSEMLTEKINSAIVSVLGTIILTLFLHILLKQIFRVVDGKIEKNIQVEVFDRIRGAIDGLFLIFEPITWVTFTARTHLTADKIKRYVVEYFLLPSKIDIYKLERNLN